MNSTDFHVYHGKHGGVSIVAGGLPVFAFGKDLATAYARFLRALEVHTS